MAKHKHRNHDSEVQNNNMNNAPNINNNPFGIDPFQIMNLLGGNLDVNNISNMLSTMNTNGFNIGNLESIAKMAGINLNAPINNPMNQQMNNQNPPINDSKMESDEILDLNKENEKTSSKNRNSSHKKENKKIVEDENLIFLKQLRAYIHPEKTEFIDRLIKAYSEGKL